MLGYENQLVTTDAYSEDEFDLKQAKLRTKLRIENGRGKPIDFLSQYLEKSETNALKSVLKNPLNFIKCLKLDELMDLQMDIKFFQEMEKHKNLEFWSDLLLIVENEMYEKRNSDSSGLKKLVRSGINTSVKSEIDAICNSKSLKVLEDLHIKVNNKISNGQIIDVAYWETLRDCLRIRIAEKRLLKIHEEYVNSTCLPEDLLSSAEQNLKGKENFDECVSSNSEQNMKENRDEGFEVCEDNPETYSSEKYSPKLIPFCELPVDINALESSDDFNNIVAQQVSVHKYGYFKNDATAVNALPFSSMKYAYKCIKRKYKPRKPRYFNRVHTGFEWNKYNQTHYDMNNPPPKVVQGYKFNIFYPDLIDSTKIPEYTVMPCDDRKKFAILKFHGGPPYEDIAFKIVNHEWDFSRKRGFRCQFYNNVFQLWFHFKKFRYRR